MKNIARVHIALFIVNLIYAGNYTIAKEIIPHHIHPFGVILIRVVCASVIFSLFHLFFLNEKIKYRDLPLFIICALFGVAANQLLFFKGLAITTPINAAVIMTSNPILVLIAASILIKEKITFTKVAGILCGISGALLLILYGKDFSLGSDTFEGDICIFFNSVSLGIFLVLAKPLMNKYHPLTVIRWVFSIGILFVFPFGWDTFGEVKWSDFSTEVWLALSYVVICTTVIAYLLNFFALKHVNPSVVSIYIYLQPLLGGLIAILWNKDKLDIVKISATLFIFAGVFLVSKNNNSSINNNLNK